MNTIHHLSTKVKISKRKWAEPESLMALSLVGLYSDQGHACRRALLERVE